MKILLLTILNSLLLATGQILWKTGMYNKDIRSLKQILFTLFDPYIFGGLCIYGITTLLWLFIISKADLSYVYPIQSIVLVIMVVSSALVFKETVTINRWVGAIIIGIGVVVAGSK